MYKLFALPLLLCIGGLFIAATNIDDNETKETSFNPLTEYDLFCMDVELKTQAVRCYGFCDGVLEVIVTGGQEPYTYQWSNGLTTDFSATLPAGEFSVTVTDAGGCEVVASATVGSPAEIKPNLEVSSDCDSNTPIVASVSPIGGVGNYDIKWSTGETGRSISDLEPGQTYSVTITTKGNGCSVTENFTVTEGLTVNTEKTDIACGNDNTGTATTIALSGQAPYTFQWSTGFLETSNNSSTIDDLAADTYTITVTDASGCEAIEEIEIIDGGGLNLDLDSAPSTCKGDEDGMANVIPSGGTAPYRYEWSDGQTTGSAINLEAGTYSVTVTDITGCEQVGSVVVESSSNLEVTATTNTSNGTVTVMASGGVEPYTYLWSNGETTANSSVYEAGDEYSVTVTDALGCQKTVTNKFPPISGELMISINPIAPTCPMFTNGGLETTVSGGVAPYTYEWSTGQTTPDISGLEEGTYGVTVTDADGATASSNITLTSPDPITINIEPTSGDICDGSSTDYEANVTGGTAPYTYAWSNGNTNSTLSNIEPGDYFLTVTDASNCEKIAYLKVRPPFDVKVIGQAVRCADFCDGSVRAMVTGGKSPFTYVWSNGQTGQILEALPVGSYTVTVTDDNGCEAIATGEVTAPPAIEANLRIDGTCEGGSEITAIINPTGGIGDYTILWSTGDTGTSIANLERGQAYTVKITDENGCSITENFTIPLSVGLVLQGEKTDIACGDTRGGSATVTVLSGTAPYTYDWIGFPDVTTEESSNTIDNLAQGTYRVTVTDANQCRGVRTFVIEKKQTLILETGSTPSTCEDSPDGMANVVPIGGIAPYTYLWSDGQTTGTAINVTSGEYTVTVTDSRGCQGIATATVEAGAGFEVEASVDETNGTITVTPNGGTAPYTYAWDNGETTQTASNYQGGDTYSVTVTDANGCSTTVTGELPTVDFGIRITSNPPTCHNFSDGSITANAVGGTAPYTYVWSTGQTGATITGLTAGEYSVTVTDAEGATTSTTVTLINPDPIVVNIEPSSGDVCDGTNTDYEANVTGGTMPYTYKWSDGSTSSTLSTNMAGDYFLTVTDANGCEKIEFLKVSPPLEVEVIGQAVRCDDFCDGSVRAKITGGTGPFTFVWSNGETTQILENLPVGSYTVTVTDANGCEVVATGEVTAPPPIDINLRVDGTCEENSEKTASVNPDGGVGNYSIKWSTGATGNSIGDLQSGQTYSVTVTDGNGCNETETFTIPEDPALVLNTEKTDIACGNTTGGSATVNVFSGDAPYTYTWSNGFSETTDATTSTIENLEAGTYSVAVTDANGCEGMTTITILENDGLILELTSSNACCEDTSDGMANVEVFGGTAPYIYEWSNGQTVGTATGLAPGEYMVTVTDIEGCEGTGSVTVNPSLIIDLSVTVDTMNNTVTVNPSGSEGEYTYLWSNGETTQTATGYQSCEEYSVTVTLTVTNAEGNEKSCDETISGKLPCDPDEPLTATVETMATCEGEANGMATLTISGGVPPYTIDWGDGTTDELTNTNLAAGTYTVTVTDSEGNSQVIEYTIDAISITAEIIIDETNNSVTVTPSGGIEPYTYLWDNGETTATATNYATCADYSVKITDAKGCMLTVDGRIPGDLVVTVETMPTCEGESTGMATLNIECGVPPYTIDWRNGTGEITNTGLAAGSYIVTVTDSEGDSEVINYTIDEIIISAEITYDTTTNSVTVTPSGGVEPYTYLWDNGETTATATGYEVCDTYSVTVTDAKACTKTFSSKVPSGKPDVTIETNPTCQGENTGSATITINGCDGPYTFNWGSGVTDDLTNINLEGGTYTVTVIDANGNTQEIEYTVDELVVEAEIMPTSPACNSNESGSATATVTEGEAPFTYEWSNGVILTSEEMTSTITNLAVGIYTLTITDSNGCKTTKEFEIRNQDITATTTSTPTSCDSSTGTASVTVNGGTAPYTYEWSNGVTETSEESTSTITDLEEGTYEVTVTDANGCKVTTTVTVERENNLQVEVTKTDACCEDSTDGTATVTVLNGVEPYTYIWSNGATTATATGLATGDYEVTVTDAGGCEGIGMITIDPIVTIDLSVEVDTINSTVTVNPSSNREGEYTYEWSNGETTQTATGYVNCDEYSVTVTLTTTDSEGNEKICTEEISGKLPCDEIKTTPTCEGEANGTAMLTLIGGNPPYTIDWGGWTNG